MTWLVLFFISFSSHAEFFRGPQSSALGGTGRAGLSSTEGVFLNPALVALIPGYEALAYYRDGEIDSGQHRHAYGVGLMDNGSDVAFAGAFNYLRLRDTGRAAGPANGELFHVTAGQSFRNQFALGASVYRLEYEVARANSYQQWNYSLGAIWTPVEGMAVAYVLENLAKPAAKTPVGLREDLSQNLGLSFTLAQLARLRVDITRLEKGNPDQKLNFGVGLESVTSEFILARLGHRHDGLTNQRIWTAGLGFNGPRLRLDYSFEKNQERASGALHSVDMTLPF